MPWPLSSRVANLALLSRILLLALTLLWRILGRPYDTSALLNPPCISSDLASSVKILQPPGFGGWLRTELERTIVWDGVYYVRIAQCGYEYEQNFAFLPLLPLSIRLIGNTVFAGLIPLVGYRATLALSGYLLNNFAFVLSAIFFHKVSLTILENEKLAFRATALFCFNPASIFYASIYSESLFSLLSFAGLWKFLSGSNWKAACLFGLSGGVRSNGVIHGGFLLFHAMQEVYIALFHHNKLKMAVWMVGVVALQTIVVFSPFVAFQIYGFTKICHKIMENGGKYNRSWCNAKIPYLYGFVQSQYWDVGFMKYFQIKQLPNFLLALPILSLAACSIAAYVKYKPLLFFSLGLCASPPTMSADWSSDSKVLEKHFLEERRPHNLTHSMVAISKGTNHIWQRRQVYLSQIDGVNIEDKYQSLTTVDTLCREGFFSALNIPFLLEMAFMALVALFIMHVQVATRFLSVCAPIYWFSAYIMRPSDVGYMRGYLIWTIFFIFVSLGSLLFVNFYPFT